MQRYNCNVRPGGDVIHDVPRINISAAEIMVLQSIHGTDAVVNIKVGKGAGDKTPHKAEYDRLVTFYGIEKVAPVLGSGYAINLPNRLSDIGMEITGDEVAEGDAPKKRGPKKRAEKAQDEPVPQITLPPQVEASGA